MKKNTIYTAEEYLRDELDSPVFFPEPRFFSDTDVEISEETRAFFLELDRINDGLDKIDKELDNLIGVRQ